MNETIQRILIANSITPEPPAPIFLFIADNDGYVRKHKYEFEGAPVWETQVVLGSIPKIDVSPNYVYVCDNSGRYMVLDQNDGSEVLAPVNINGQLVAIEKFSSDDTQFYVAKSSGLLYKSDINGNVTLLHGESDADIWDIVVDSNDVAYTTSRNTNPRVVATNPDGSVKWSKLVGGDAHGICLDEFNGWVYVGVDGSGLMKLDITDGSTLATFAFSSYSNNVGDQIYDVALDEQNRPIVCTNNNWIVKHDQALTTEIWSLDISPDGIFQLKEAGDSTYWTAAKGGNVVHHISDAGVDLASYTDAEHDSTNSPLYIATLNTGQT